MCTRFTLLQVHYITLKTSTLQVDGEIGTTGSLCYKCITSYLHYITSRQKDWYQVHFVTSALHYITSTLHVYYITLQVDRERLVPGSPHQESVNVDSQLPSFMQLTFIITIHIIFIIIIHHCHQGSIIIVQKTSTTFTLINPLPPMYVQGKTF